MYSIDHDEVWGNGAKDAYYGGVVGRGLGRVGVGIGAFAADTFGVMADASDTAGAWLGSNVFKQ